MVIFGENRKNIKLPSKISFSTLIAKIKIFKIYEKIIAARVEENGGIYYCAKNSTLIGTCSLRFLQMCQK